MRKAKLTKPSEGYFLAKREAQDKLAGRIEVLNEKVIELRLTHDTELTYPILEEIKVLEKVYDMLRNTMLWDTSKGP